VLRLKGAAHTLDPDAEHLHSATLSTPPGGGWRSALACGVTVVATGCSGAWHDYAGNAMDRQASHRAMHRDRGCQSRPPSCINLSNSVAREQLVRAATSLLVDAVGTDRRLGALPDGCLSSPSRARGSRPLARMQSRVLYLGLPHLPAGLGLFKLFARPSCPEPGTPGAQLVNFSERLW